jgi:hypothetical protein
MRASRETELAKEYPIHIVCQWLGNTPRIALKHYLQVTDADFEKAAKVEEKSGAKGGAVGTHGEEWRSENGPPNVRSVPRLHFLT